MSDDQNTNPLGAKIENLEELLKDTEAQVTTTLQELQEAEESGDLEEYLASKKTKKDT